MAENTDAQRVGVHIRIDRVKLAVPGDADDVLGLANGFKLVQKKPCVVLNAAAAFGINGQCEELGDLICIFHELPEGRRVV